jgi:lipopolysaccharide/colanic/teichoic acid biosynthesis glycosyltransferase
MLVILLTSGRPVLYRGLRVGRAGRTFTMYKLRTLRPDAETRLGPYQASALDRRTPEELTRVGRWLRSTHLDELPQLWNVVCGDMSLVGPRPIRPVFFEQLCEEIPQYWQRLVVRPGLTGLAQLRMARDMTWAEKLAHDLEWLADRSVGLYLRLVLATVWRLTQRSAGDVTSLLR